MKTIVVSLLASLVVCATARAQYEDWEQAEESSGSFEPEVEPQPLPSREPVEEATAEPSAEDVPPPERAGSFVVWAELATFFGTFVADLAMATGQMDVFVVSPMAGVGWHPTDTLRVSAEIGTSVLGHGDVTGTIMEDGGARFVFGNVLLAAALLDQTESLSYELGVGVTLPTAPTGDIATFSALSLANAMRGAWDPWLWAAERLSLIASGRLETALAEQIFLIGEADVGVLFYAGDSDGETLFAAQAAADFEYRTGDLALGARLQGVLADDFLPDRKSFELAAMPYFRVALGETAHVGAGFLLNLIPPYGFSFGTGKVWSLRIFAGF